MANGTLLGDAEGSIVGPTEGIKLGGELGLPMGSMLGTELGEALATALGGKAGTGTGRSTGCLVLLGLALALGSKLSPNERSYLNKRSNLLVSATQQTLCPRHVETHKAYTERICISDSRKEFMKRTRLSRQKDKNSAVRLSVILLPSLDHQWFSQFDYEKQVAQPSQQLRTVEPASKS